MDIVELHFILYVSVFPEAVHHLNLQRPEHKGMAEHSGGLSDLPSTTMHSQLSTEQSKSSKINYNHPHAIFHML